MRAQPRANAQPPWSKGIAALGPESYYHAIECGKQGGDDPPCVFWDSGLCKNDDFAMAMYTPYKQVAYEVWQAVRKKQAPPQPNYPGRAAAARDHRHHAGEGFDQWPDESDPAPRREAGDPGRRCSVGERALDV